MLLDHREASQYSTRNRPSKDGKPLSYFTERSEVLVRIGPSGLLYLRFLQITFVFLFVLSCIEIGHTYIFYKNNPTNENVIWRLSIANWSPAEPNNYSDSIILAALEGAALVSFLLYVQLFGMYRDRLNKGADKIIRSVSEYSVHVRNVPKDEPQYGTLRLRKFFSHFGRVIDVKFGLNSGNVNKWRKQLSKLSNSIQHCQAMMQTRSSLLAPYFKLKLFKEKRAHAKLEAKIKEKLEADTFSCTGDAFVTFNCERARFMCLHYFNRPWIQTMCSNMRFKSTPEKLVRLRVQEAKPHTDVVWENLEYGFFSRLLRRSVAVIIALITMGVCVVVSYYLTYVQKVTIKDYFNGYKLSGINYGISVVMVVAGIIASNIMYSLGDFEKHRSKSSKATSQLIKLAVMLFFVGVVVMGPYMETATNLSQLVPLIEQPLEAFYESNDFYYQLLTSFVTAVASNVLIQVVQLPAYWIYGKICARLAVTQEELNKAYMPPLYDFTFRYSNQLRIIMLSLCFSALFPPGLFIACVGLLASFLVDKFNLIKAFAKNNKVEDHLTENAVWCLCLAWLLRYILLAVRVYYLTCLTPPLSITNPYLLSYIACSGTYLIFLVLTYVLKSGTSTLVHLFCCSKYRFPEYVTDKKGISAPDPSLRLYNPPITIEEILRNKVKKTMMSSQMTLLRTPSAIDNESVTCSTSSPDVLQSPMQDMDVPPVVVSATAQHEWEEEEQEALQGPTIADLQDHVPQHMTVGDVVPLIESPTDAPYLISAVSPYDQKDIEMEYMTRDVEQIDVDIPESKGGQFVHTLSLNL
ncbi:9 TM domain-containing transmembrane protein [Acrasis kona]|uniref:9 TM domain-containing transmembrane protein n=1 Tax=Acrasis kona TaxID=1008807 RepID=A0AAW2ZA88_9EUKA